MLKNCSVVLKILIFLLTMDAKALAKSKRAHSQHHSKKHHPNITLKAPLVGPVGDSSAKKPSGKQVREKPHPSRGSSTLPSNWDRYEEEYGSGSEDSSHTNTSQATDAVAKSKGADYVHLISEAKSQSQTNISSESFPSFDDVLSDFNQGVGSLLSVRGQGILSWTGDDNFVVEDRAIASHEASFLSLNLHLLAEQLAKVDLSQRLFIEPDFLPPELCTEESKTSFSRESDQVQAAWKGEGLKKYSGELVVHGYHDSDKTEDQISEFMSPESSGIHHSVSSSFYQGLKSTNQVMNEPSLSGGTGESTVQAAAAEAELDMLLDSFSETKFLDSSGVTKKSSETVLVQQEISSQSRETGESTVQATAAEAELDMLLDSFSETKFRDSSGVTKKSSETILVQRETSSRLERISSSKQDPAPLSRKGPDSSKPSPVATNFDDALDDLLKETSSSVTFSVRQEETSTSLLGGIPSVQSAPAQPSRKGPDLSKSAPVMANFDNALDDLLKETSELTNQNGTSQSQEVMAARLNTMPSSSSGSGSGSNSKVLDDFDSWFDTV